MQTCVLIFASPSVRPVDVVAWVFCVHRLIFNKLVLHVLCCCRFGGADASKSPWSGLWFALVPNGFAFKTLVPVPLSFQAESPPVGGVYALAALYIRLKDRELRALESWT
jgi:hypothetical protein